MGGKSVLCTPKYWSSYYNDDDFLCTFTDLACGSIHKLAKKQRNCAMFWRSNLLKLSPAFHLRGPYMYDKTRTTQGANQNCPFHHGEIIP